MLTLTIYRKSNKEEHKCKNDTQQKLKNDFREEIDRLNYDINDLYGKVNTICREFDSHDIGIKTLATELNKTNKKLHELQQSNNHVEKRVYNHYNSFV